MRGILRDRVQPDAECNWGGYRVGRWRCALEDPKENFLSKIVRLVGRQLRAMQESSEAGGKSLAKFPECVEVPASDGPYQVFNVVLN
jgi:hypothetical protein